MNTKRKKILISLVILAFILIAILFFKKIFNESKQKKDNIKDIKSPSILVNNKKKKYETIEQIKELFNKLNVEYSNHSKFDKECQIFKKINKSDFSHYLKNKDYYDKLTQKYDLFVKSGYIAPVYIKWVNDQIGYGCFASTDIPQGNLIAEYVGEIIPKNKIASKIWSWKYPCKGTFSKKFPKNISINAFKFGNETRFINHGVDSKRNLPNCTIEFAYTNGAWRILYVAKRYINKDEELLVDYGLRYWRKRELIK